MPIDPVCGMEIGEDSQFNSSLGGRTVYFCYPHCKSHFDKNRRNSIPSPNIMIKAAFGAILLVFLLSSQPSAFAQNARAQTVLTGAGELDINLDISFPERKDTATVFTITFSDPVTGEVEEHVYYDFLLVKDDKNIFRAGTQGGATVGIIHSVTGIEKQFFTFSETGSYTARIVIFGLKMVFVEQVTADFPVIVTPEFHVVMPVLAAAASVIAFMRFGTKQLRIFN